MPNNNTIVALLVVFTTSINAYEFSFFNDTPDPIAIAIQLGDGENEPLYKEFIKPGEMNSFVPGKHDIPDIKWSFCLKTIYYAKDPTIDQRAHYFEKTVWRKVPITWTTEPLQTEKKPKRLPKKKAQKKQPTDLPVHRMVMKKAVIKTDDKSLCRDRHFEITENEHGNIAVMGSTAEKR